MEHSRALSGMQAPSSGPGCLHPDSPSAVRSHSLEESQHSRDWPLVLKAKQVHVFHCLTKLVQPLIVHPQRKILRAF